MKTSVFEHGKPLLTLDSSSGFSRRGAETAEYAEKVPETEAFRSPAHTLRQKTDSPKWGKPVKFQSAMIHHGIYGTYGIAVPRNRCFPVVSVVFQSVQQRNLG